MPDTDDTHTASEPLIVGWRGASTASGRSVPSLKRDVRAGRFPAPIELGPNRLGWRQGWITEWLASRPRRQYYHNAPNSRL
jgi:predicted DNA-binding transcriptional regulator AlpA